jgi:DNA polymerase elongation subunit (family B)
MTEPRVLVFDVETAPMTAYVWARRDVNIGLNQIKHDWFVLAFAAKWLGAAPSTTIYRDQRNAKRLDNDKDLLLAIWKLLDEADIVITQNGRRFDSRKLNARFIIQGINPPSPYKHLDTYQIVRNVADFTSNSLEYLTGKLCTKYKKLTHGKFPGMELWNACLAGNQAAWKEMKRYNIHDVLSTEELYMKIRAWAPQNAPAVHRVNDPALDCPVCGAKGRCRRNGYHTTKAGKFPQMQCTACFAYHQGPKETKTKGGHNG